MLQGDVVLCGSFVVWYARLWLQRLIGFLGEVVVPRILYLTQKPNIIGPHLFEHFNFQRNVG